MLRRQILIIVPVLFITACQPAKITTGILDVKDAWARPAASGDNGAIYFVIENGTNQDDALLSVQSDAAEAVELHLSQMEGDHMSMRQHQSVEIPAGEAVIFSPGGWHVMLVGLTRELKTGETFVATLTFEKAGQKTVTVTVRDDIGND